MFLARLWFTRWLRSDLLWLLAQTLIILKSIYRFVVSARDGRPASAQEANQGSKVLAPKVEKNKLISTRFLAQGLGGLPGKPSKGG